MKEDRKEYYRQYYQRNKERKNQYWRDKYQSPERRATVLVAGYKRDDIKYYGGNGKDTITANFLLDRLYPKGCFYCGSKDMSKLGADRIDNTKPHTEDNVVCCCWDCNNRRNTESFIDFYKKEFGRYRTPLLYY